MGIQIINNNHVNQLMKQHVQKFTKLKEDAHFHKNEPFPLHSLLRHLMVHKTNLSEFFLPKETNYLNQVQLNSHYARIKLMDLSAETAPGAGVKQEMPKKNCNLDSTLGLGS
jgi:hypothetical protein